MDWTEQRPLGHSEKRLYAYFFGIAKALCRIEERSLAYVSGSVDRESEFSTPKYENTNPDGKSCRLSLGPMSLATCLEPSLFPTRLNTGPTTLTGCGITFFTFRTATWLILPVVICFSQRLSHTCLSTSLTKVKPRMAH